VCTPLLAWNASIGCGVTVVGDDCALGVYDCVRSGTLCTVAEGLPEPCASDPGSVTFGTIFQQLIGRVPLDMAPEVRLPLLLCIQRYHTAYPDGGSGVCYGVLKCGQDCAEECERWFNADPEAAYDMLLSVLLENDAGLATTPLARAMELLPQ
jgi:hypothetical protein